ncbi:tRNA (adenosine(37)-N6)-dimethylallyltransferase MiaA [soil metagenome]
MSAAPSPLPFPIIYGATASGKSALALALHDLFQCRGHPSELVTADAFQVYRGMDIGTAKPSAAERARVPHHVIDLMDPHGNEPFTAAQWLARAEAAIAACRARGVIPIVVGGTSLYIQSLLMGMFEGPPADAALRAALTALGAAARRAELGRVDPAAALRIHASDERRTIRALEVFRLTGTPISTLQREWEQRAPRADARPVILHRAPETLNPRINARVKTMFAAGLLDEVRALSAGAPLNRQAREALGYKQVLAHLERPRDITLDDACERTKIETRRFARNQRTWIKRIGALPGALRLDADALDAEAMATRVADSILTPAL